MDFPMAPSHPYRVPHPAGPLRDARPLTAGLVGRGSQLGRAALELLPAAGRGHSLLACLRLRRYRRRLRRGAPMEGCGMDGYL